jgi:excisionase family DNA binding protein
MSEYLTTKELAERYKVAPSTVAAMVKQGGLPGDAYVRFGRVFRFNAEKIEKYLIDLNSTSAQGEQLEFDFDADNEN